MILTIKTVNIATSGFDQQNNASVKRCFLEDQISTELTSGVNKIFKKNKIFFSCNSESFIAVKRFYLLVMNDYSFTNKKKIRNCYTVLKVKL